MARPPPKSINFGDFKTCELTHSIRSDSEHTELKNVKKSLKQFYIVKAVQKYCFED